jgi:DNA-binding NtrC family response regulator
MTVPLPPLLVVDDEKNMRLSLQTLLGDEGYSVLAVESAEAGLELLANENVFMVITDARLGGMSGYDFLHKIRSRWPELPILMITAYATPKLAVEVIKAGAMDYLAKPFAPEELLHSVSRCAERHRLLRTNAQLLARASETYQLDQIVGDCAKIRELRQLIQTVAPTDARSLILGESGTGKELVARALHRLSARRDRRWAAVNCAALTDELLEAELFGHVRGAFTGAVGPRVGLLEDAHEGTLFLDEVAELSPRAQAKLLRVIQEGEIRRVGENVSRRVDVRLVTATNRSLAESARLGDYRDDLIYRLAVIRLRVPPLRERIEDVPILAHAFWRNVAGRVPTRAVLAPTAIAALCRAPWPGNVRELQNVIAALAVGGPSGGRIGAPEVESLLAERPHGGTASPPLSLAVARLQCDRQTVAASLARHANQRAAAARELGVSRQGLAKLIARLNLDERPSI